MIPVEIENARLKLALIIPTGAPITVANDAIEMLPVVTDKTINDLSKYSKEAIYLLSLLLINSLSLKAQQQIWDILQGVSSLGV